MHLILKPFLSIFLILILNTFLSQVNRSNFCAHDQELYKKIKTDSVYIKKVEADELNQKQHLINYKNSSASRAGTVYYIPIVYHVIHEGGQENISDAQIMSDLAEINRLYRKLNSNVGTVNPAFSSIVADVEIEFRLAQKKNDGTCFKGITRTYSSATNTGGNDATDAVKAAHGDFPGNKYLNIYIAKNIGGAAGYTYRPGWPYQSNMRNGIHVLHTYVGNIGTSTQTNVNTTLAHEAGHWLNLPHLWGSTNSPGVSSNCSDDDGVTDTPNTIGWSSCNVNGNTCSSLDNVENIMEYSYCSKMFTEGQKTKMRAAITSTVGGRNNVISAANYTATGIFADIMCAADFSVENPAVCQGDTVYFKDESYHNPTSWSWSFPGGTPSSSNLQNPKVTYSAGGRHNVSLTVTNANGTKSTTKSTYVKVFHNWGESLPYSEGFEFTQTDLDIIWHNVSTLNKAWEVNSNSYSGGTSAYLNNFAINKGGLSELSSRTINLLDAATVNINFKYAYARKTATTGESFRFLVSTDCGKNWAILKVLQPTVSSTDTEFFPSATGDWKNVNVNINGSYFKSNFRFKFQMNSGEGNNVFVDDINISRTVGIEELATLNNFSVFPNPISDNATISLDLNKASSISVDLLNTVGKKVKSLVNNKNLKEGNSRFTFNKGGLSSGVYFLKVTIDGQSKLSKLIVN